MSLTLNRVLLLDNVDPAAATILNESKIEATLDSTKYGQKELIEKLQTYDGVVVRSATRITSDIIKACPNLKIIGRAGTGVDNIDVKAATRNGCLVMNTPSGNTISAAEHTCTLICSLARNVPAADASMKAGKWDRKRFMGHELYGKTLAIVGLGRIGMEVGKRMRSFGMTTIGYDPMVSKKQAAKEEVEWLSLDEIWPRADYITVHTPLIPQTKGLLNKESFLKCKKGVRVINCARGGIIDEADLLEAFRSGQCGGAGLDVFVEEPSTNLDLINHPSCIACPHLGASTREAQARCGRDIALQFVAASLGKSMVGVLNAPSLCQPMNDDAQKWIDIAISLGKIISAYGKHSPNGLKLTLISSGDAMINLARSLSAGICCGMLSLSNKDANLVSAPLLAQEQGIQVKVTHNHDASSDYLEAHYGNIRLIGGISGDKLVLTAVNEQHFACPLPLEGFLMFAKIHADYQTLAGAISSLAIAGACITAVTCTPTVDNHQWLAVTTSNEVYHHHATDIKTAMPITVVKF